MQYTYIDLAQARLLVDAALEAAQAEQLPIAVVVTDPAGHLVLAARADGARSFAVDAATRKAVTAGGFGAPTHGLAQWAQRDASFAAAFVGSPTLTLLPGGLPIALDGETVGGLGVAGGRSEQDQAIAETALRSLASAPAVQYGLPTPQP